MTSFVFWSLASLGAVSVDDERPDSFAADSIFDMVMETFRGNMEIELVGVYRENVIGASTAMLDFVNRGMTIWTGGDLKSVICGDRAKSTWMW